MPDKAKERPMLAGVSNARRSFFRSMSDMRTPARLTGSESLVMKFIDETKIRAIAGDGGPGSVSFYRAKFVRRGPADGGNGGHGGDVVAIADPQLSTLLDLRYRKGWKANPGKRGGDADCDGRRGDDCIIKVPVGTLIRDVVSGELLADLKTPGERAVIAAGGRGGKGNAHFASSTIVIPRFCQPGEPGVERDLEVELRLLADVGIIGLPNAGKSTLISVDLGGAAKNRRLSVYYTGTQSGCCQLRRRQEFCRGGYSRPYRRGAPGPWPGR